MTAPATPLPPQFAALLPRPAPPATVDGLPPEFAALLPPAQAASRPRVSTHAARAASSAQISAPARGATQPQTLPPEFAALLPKPTPAPAAAPPMTEMQRAGNFLFGKAVDKPWTWHSLWGLPDAAASIATGTAAQVAGGLAGLGDLAWTRNPADAAQTVQRVEHALTYQPHTSGGQAVKHFVSLPFAALGAGANWAGGKVADVTGSPLAGALANAGIQGLPMLAGGELPALRDTPTDVGPAVAPEVAAAREAGIKLTPTQAQAPGGAIGRGIESLTGTAKLERALSRANAATVGRLAGEDIGVEGPLTRAALKDAKAAPNAVYAEVARLGNVPVDDVFRQQIAGIANPGGGSFSFDTPADIARLKEGYGSLKNFDAGDAVAKARQLRRDAGANIGARYNPMQQALGHAQRAVADALEDQIDRHLQAVANGRSPTVERTAPLEYDPAKAPVPKRNMVEPDPREDSILQWLAKHPKGLSAEEAEAQGLDPADMRSSAARVGIKRAFRQGGMSFDQAAEALHQAGYPVADERGNYSPNALLDAVDGELHGKPSYSVANTRRFAEVAHEAAAAPQSAEPPDLTDLTTEAMKANPQRAQAVLDSWGDDSNETIARVQRELRDVVDSAKPPAPRNDLIDRYRQARVQLAKINTVDQALRAGNGQVSALNLAKQLDRGAPLSGNLRAVAEAAQHVPRAMQDLSKIRDEGPLSALDLKLEGGLGILKPLAALKALPAFALPPVVRAILGSDLYQDAAFGPREAPTPPTPIELSGRALPAVAAAHSASTPLAGILGHMHWPAVTAQLLPALAMGPAAPIATESAIQRLLRGLHAASGEHGGRPPRPIGARVAAAGLAP